jgi:hypothetical protein
MGLPSHVAPMLRLAAYTLVSQLPGPPVNSMTQPATGREWRSTPTDTQKPR